MTEAESLCRVDWKLGQPLMPEHFLRQEVSLRNEWEQRFGQQALPMWGVSSIAWDEDSLAKSGRLTLTSLEVVFESGLLVDIPGNADSVSVNLPEPAEQPVDVYLHLDSSPSIVSSGGPDQEGGLIELRKQKLILALAPLNTPQPGLLLMRFQPIRIEGTDEAPEKTAKGWQWDTSFVPPLTSLWGLRPFAVARFVKVQALLKQWFVMLRSDAVEQSLAVHKRVEAQMCLRSAYELQWYLYQLAPSFGREAQATAEQRLVPALRTHPFDFYERLVRLYIDIFTFRSTPLQVLRRLGPASHLYQHTEIAECYEKVEKAIETELRRPGAGSPQWSFALDLDDPDRMVCAIPKDLEEGHEVYFLVEFTGPHAQPEFTDNDLDKRLLGLRLAAPERLDSVEKRALSGVVFERVRLIPFPHNFDAASVQFYRLKQGMEWQAAYKAKALCYYSGQRGIARSYIYCPDVAGG